MEIKGTVVLDYTMRSTKDIIVHQGGTRSSKTYSIAQWIVLQCLQQSGKIYSVVRKTMPALRKTAMRDVIEILKVNGLYTEKSHNKTDNIYNLNGNEIQFFSVDDSQKVRGSKRDVLWINESNELDVEDWRQLLIRTSGKKILDFNPSESEEHWIYTDVLSRDDVDLFISTYKDNPFLAATQISEIERFKHLDPSFWMVYGEGKRSDLQTGTVFHRSHYREYSYLPPDVKSVLYCDPNLAIKAKGDSTAITNLGYSANEDKYYIIDAACQSFPDSNELLNQVFVMKRPFTIAIGFDGNVTQESTWTNFVKNWSKIHGQPFPRIEYKRYKVDDLSKNIQLTWNEDKIYFPAGFKESLGSKHYLAQLFSFRGKKFNMKDDAPDSLICAFEFLHERRLTAVKQEIFTQPVINPAYSW